MGEAHIWEALAAVNKKLEGLKGFHLPVILQTIENYEQSGIEQCFIDQEKAKLQKVVRDIAELEGRSDRLKARLR